jgi:DNA-binding NtrC family response regulator
VQSAFSAPPSASLPSSSGLENFKLDTLEKDALVRALHAAHGNKSKAAELLGVSRKRLYRMLNDYGFEKEAVDE